jgi:hypothetical protein
VRQLSCNRKEEEKRRRQKQRLDININKKSKKMKRHQNEESGCSESGTVRELRTKMMTEQCFKKEDTHDTSL